MAVVAQNFDDGLRAQLDAVGDNALIGDDGFGRLLRRAAGIHRDRTRAGQIARGRRYFDDFVQTGPKRLGCCAAVFTNRLDGRNDNRALLVNHIALTIQNVLCGKHLKLCACQFAVSAYSGHSMRVSRIFVCIPLVERQPYLYRLVGCDQFGRFIRFDRSLQGDFLKNVAHCRTALLHDVLTLLQRR